VSTVWLSEPATPSEFTAQRRLLSAALHDGSRPDHSDEDGVEGLLLGLYLVARLCAAHGWDVDGDRKHVWAYVSFDSAETALPPGIALPRPRGGTPTTMPWRGDAAQE
jgi:hypothetical protein